MKDVDLIKSLNGDMVSIEAVASYLDYTVGKNPVDPDSEWRILFSDKTPDHSKGVIALKCVPELSIRSKTVEVRRLYKQVEDLKQSLTTNFDVLIVGFVGMERLVFFPFMNGNRDMRVDLNRETIAKQMYATNFNLMSNSNLRVEEDEFGFGDYKLSLKIQDIFKRELTTTFLLMVQFYRKKLSELITSTNLKQSLKPLVTTNTRAFLIKDDLAGLVQQESYSAVLSTVVDTIILRQLMRRFLEGYYGTEKFAVDGISLGVGSGTLDAAIKKAVHVAVNAPEDSSLKKINQKKKPLKETSGSLDIFTGLFDDDEINATSKLERMSESQKADVAALTEHAREQYAAVYAGDLFSGSVGKVATQIEKEMELKYPEFVTKMWLDTSSDQFSFRYEDMAPESLEKQYEDSMSQDVQITLDKDGEPVVFYGDDKQEQKQKGAYYTDQKLVDYIVKQTVEVQFMERFSELKEAVKASKTEKQIRSSIEYLLSMKVVDMTCGGGSFLRGAFLKLAEKQDLLASLQLTQSIASDYPMFLAGERGECAWEDFLLNHVIYGIDIDYKAITIASLTLTLSSLQHRDPEKQLPSLVGKTLIHQNSLVNMISWKHRKNIFAHFKTQIAHLRKLKVSESQNFEEQRVKLQGEMTAYAQVPHAEELNVLNGQILEINLPEVFFDSQGNFMPSNGFTCVVGNPPWDILDANSDEFYGQYDREYLKLPNATAKEARRDQLDKKIPVLLNRWTEYKAQIEAEREYLNNDGNYHFQSWTNLGKKKASKPNLYKICLERFFQCLQPGGRIGVVIQDSFAYDGGAAGLRHLFFEHARVNEYLSFENRKKIFKSVDSRFRFAVLTATKSKSSEDDGESTNNFKTFFYQHELARLEDESVKFDYPIALIHQKPDLLSLIEVHNSRELEIYEKIAEKFPRFETTKPFETGTDFNRTTSKKLFTPDSAGSYLLFQGRNIKQFVITTVPTEYVNGEAARQKLGKDLQSWRIAWRDIASSTNRRSIIATLLPPYTASTHSINIQRHLTGQESLEEQCFYLGLLNSYVLDFFIRPLIGTHVSKYFIEQLPIPKYIDLNDANIIAMITVCLLSHNSSKMDAYKSLQDDVPVERRLLHRDEKELVAELNARIALDFGLTRNDMIQLLQTFESAKHQKVVREEAQRILNVMDTLTK